MYNSTPINILASYNIKTYKNPQWTEEIKTYSKLCIVLEDGDKSISALVSNHY